jgi:hypothetical protein
MAGRSQQLDAEESAKNLRLVCVDRTRSYVSIRFAATDHRNCVRTVSHTPETLDQHHDLRGHVHTHRCCGKSLIGSALVGFEMRQHAPRESISKRSRSSAVREQQVARSRWDIRSDWVGLPKRTSRSAGASRGGVALIGIAPRADLPRSTRWKQAPRARGSSVGFSDACRHNCSLTTTATSAMEVPSLVACIA